MGESTEELDGIVIYVEGLNEDYLLFYSTEELEGMAEAGPTCEPLDVIAMVSMANFKSKYYAVSTYMYYNEYLNDASSFCIEKSNQIKIPYIRVEQVGNVYEVIGSNLTIRVGCSPGGADPFVPLPVQRDITVLTLGGGSGSGSSTGGNSTTVSHPDLSININISSQFTCIAFVVTEIVNQIGSDGFGAFAHYVRSAYGTGQNSLLNINVSGELSSSTAGQFGVIEDVEGYSFAGEIRLNPNLEGCTTDRIHATVIHEMMHAYIRQRFEVIGGYSSGFFDEFPEFFGEINSPSAWEMNTHEAMTNRRLFLPMVFAQRNHNARLGVQSATLMTWGGLQYTDAFQDLDEDTANDVGLIDMASRCQPATGDTNDYRFNPC